MPHSCAVCGTVYASLAELDGGSCPVCHACKFIYEVFQDTTPVHPDSLFEDDVHELPKRNQEASQEMDAITGEVMAVQDDEAISIRIQRPGKYEINLRQMVESPDRVIEVEKKGVYYLDLHSMIRKKKKK